MLTDRRIPSKMDNIRQRYQALRFERIAEIPVEMAETKEHYRQEPGRKEDLKWKPVKRGHRWGGSFITGWFRGNVKIPKQCNGKRVFIEACTGGETLFFADSKPKGVFDRFHPVVLMALRGRTGKKHHISLEAYSGQTFPNCGPADKPLEIERKSRVFDGIYLCLEREDVSAFVFDLKALIDLVKVLDENSLRRGKILRALEEVFTVIRAMPEELEEEQWRPQLAEAREIMAPLLKSKNAPTTPHFGVIGHSHIDTAWLWPVAETWRKCARTFSSVLNLMDQYPEFKFLQPAPCHADVMRRLYPDIFRRMKRRAAEGRWEPNGAMWVEPDCNIPSGESFVRQLLVGQQAARKMFDYTADTLWLPDVFGYSAALPQILKGANVDFFCTTKLGWNDTTRFPYDTFVWKGIDGSSVIAHFNAMPPFLDPKVLTDHWNIIQHKDVQDRMLASFGPGDGGGGPTGESIEMIRRCEDLEGCPKAEYMTTSDYMKSVAKDLTDLPEWSGELYLELHRGTLTSIAAIKRGNRKLELALRDTELLCTLSALHKGQRYPAKDLQNIWITLLTNQFHDILPGSAVEEANVLAVQEYEESIEQTRELGRRALSRLCPAPRGESRNILVTNTLSWPRSGEITLPEPPQGMVPALEDTCCQRVTSLEGENQLILEGVDVPGTGSTLIELRQGRCTRGSSFEYSEDHIETPFASISMDSAGRIVSWIDKDSGRDIVKTGGVFNAFRIGEDIPEAWDNWDIDSDQRLKMADEKRLLKQRVISDGPLQLRLRSEYQLGTQSSITQDMIFHATTPRVDFDTKVDWKERRQLFKVLFNMNVEADFARHEIQYGHVERSTHWNLPQDRARFEVCAHKWTDLSENDFGVALLNDCKYGVSVTGSDVGLTLIKSSVHPDARADEGIHRFVYSVLPHACAFSVKSVVRPAYELNVAPLVSEVSNHAKPFGSLLEVDADNVIIESVKWAEEGKAFVVRLYEAGKSGTQCALTVNAPVKSVRETNLLEEKGRKSQVKDSQVDFYLKPFEIKTLVFEVQ